MDTRKQDIDVVRDDEVINPDDATVAGDVLGISHVTAGGTGEVQPPERSADDEAHQHEDHVLPLEDEVDLGARDVTKDGRGQTGPETGGHGATPRRSGATGMDIG